MKLLLVAVTVLAVSTLDGQALNDEPVEAQLFPNGDDGLVEGGEPLHGEPKLLISATEKAENETLTERNDISMEDNQMEVNLKKPVEAQLFPDGDDGQVVVEGGEPLHGEPKLLISQTEKAENETLTERNDISLEDNQIEVDDMEMLLSRSRWCRKRNGRCRQPRKDSCDKEGYIESGFGRPYCTSIKRRCCYPGNCNSSEGFFKVPGSANQCFKYLNDTVRSWEASKTKCHDEGLELAKPRDPVGLRKYLVETFGNTEVWIGARGTGLSINWIRNGEMIDHNSTLWYTVTGPRNTSPIYCLLLLSFKDEMDRRPDSPFYVYPCSSSSWYGLCELVM